MNYIYIFLCKIVYSYQIIKVILIFIEALKQYFTGLGKPKELVELSTEVETVKQEVFIK